MPIKEEYVKDAKDKKGLKAFNKAERKYDDY